MNKGLYSLEVSENASPDIALCQLMVEKLLIANRKLALKLSETRCVWCGKTKGKGVAV